MIFCLNQKEEVVNNGEAVVQVSALGYADQYITNFAHYLLFFYPIILPKCIRNHLLINNV